MTGWVLAKISPYYVNKAVLIQWIYAFSEKERCIKQIVGCKLYASLWIMEESIILFYYIYSLFYDFHIYITTEEFNDNEFVGYMTLR